MEQFIDHPEALPDDFDTEHGIWCKTMIEEAKKHLNENISLDKKEKSISYGVAAKLINVYLKSILVCGGYHEHEKVKKIHPPIDRLLLTELAKKDDYPRKNVWKKYAEKGWSKFESEDYQVVILNAKEFVKSKALYTIESFWIGYQ